MFAVETIEHRWVSGAEREPEDSSGREGETKLNQDKTNELRNSKQKNNNS